MNYRVLGKTGLQISEIGFGAEWMPGDDAQAVREVTRAAAAAGVNIVDCWMADPAVRRALGDAVCEQREQWIVQGAFRFDLAGRPIRAHARHGQGCAGVGIPA